jgi:ethanolamine utilization protein EutN
MIVCRVVGQAVSTAKDEGLRAASLLLVQRVDMTGVDAEGEPIVAVDAVGAGLGELVLVAQGSAVRQSARVSGPADAAIVAIVDSLSLDGRRTYTK